MAFTIATAHTLPEVLVHKAPDGSYMTAIDVLKKQLPFVEEAYWEQANEETSHEFLRNSSKPTGTLVRYEEGAPFEVSTDRAVREQLCRIEGNMRIDSRVLEKSNSPLQFYNEKKQRYVEGMINTMHETIFSRNNRGNMGLDPKDINGLGVRYGALGSNVVGLGGSTSGALASIWLVKHGPEGLFMLYPKTASNTIKIDDLMEQVVYDANGNPFRAWMTNFSMEFGMGIAQDNAIQRICNIEASGNNSFFADGTTVQKGEYALIDAIERLPQGSTDGVAIYVGSAMMGQMRKRLNDKSNMNYNIQDVWGRPMLHFMDVPIIRVDTLTATEATVA